MACLHPEAEELLEQRKQEGVPPMHSLSVPGLRALFAELTDTDAEVVTVADVRELAVPSPDGDVPVRVYEPTTAEPPYSVLAYFHGGGWIMGGIDSVDPLCRRLTEAARCLTVSVDYRLAPEHPFPAGLRDCHAVVRWLADHADAIHGTPDRLALAGDSAGGNLAAALALLTTERGTASPVYQLLVYPQLNYAFDTDSYRENAAGYYLTRADMEWFWGHYLEHDLDGYHPLPSPLRARDTALEGLPTTRVITCEYDPLRDDGVAFVDRLRAVGADVRHTQYEGMIHGFFRQVTALESAREAVDAVARELRSEL